MFSEKLIFMMNRKSWLTRDNLGLELQTCCVDSRNVPLMIESGPSMELIKNRALKIVTLRIKISA